MSEAIDILDMIREKTQVAKAEYDRLRQELSRTDMIISDILHELEVSSFDASEGFRYARILKTFREDRREIKNEMQLLLILINHFDKFDLLKLRDILINKETHQFNKTYKPRIITSENKEQLLGII